MLIVLSTLLASCASKKVAEAPRAVAYGPSSIHVASEVHKHGNRFVARSQDISSYVAAYEPVLVDERTDVYETLPSIVPPSGYRPLQAVPTDRRSNMQPIAVAKPQRSVWERFCEGEWLTEAELEYVRSHDVPPEWASDCHPIK